MPFFHEDLRESGSEVLCFPSCGPEWSWMVRFALRQRYFQPGVPIISYL